MNTEPLGTPDAGPARAYVGAGANRLPRRIRCVERLRLPLIVAPMFRVSGMELVHEACAAGAIGAFPAINARTPEVLDAWLSQLDDAARDDPARAPYGPNLIMKQPELRAFVHCLQRHKVELVITSVGASTPVVAPLHDIGCQVLADPLSMPARPSRPGPTGWCCLQAAPAEIPAGSIRSLSSAPFGPSTTAPSCWPAASRTQRPCTPPPPWVATSPTWGHGSSQRTKAWPVPNTRRLWGTAARTMS